VPRCLRVDVVVESNWQLPWHCDLEPPLSPAPFVLAWLCLHAVYQMGPRRPSELVARRGACEDAEKQCWMCAFSRGSWQYVNRNRTTGTVLRARPSSVYVHAQLSDGGPQFIRRRCRLERLELQTRHVFWHLLPPCKAYGPAQRPDRVHTKAATTCCHRTVRAYI
jgi:hypothetical protein